jgi:hypothetical protein
MKPNPTSSYSAFQEKKMVLKSVTTNSNTEKIIPVTRSVFDKLILINFKGNKYWFLGFPVSGFIAVFICSLYQCHDK